MSIINLSSSELIYINDIAKAIKQSEVVLFRNMIYGYSNMHCHISEMVLDPNKIRLLPDVGLIINQRELAAFIKTFSIESEFSIDADNKHNIIKTKMGGELNIYSDYYVNIKIKENILRISNINYTLDMNGGMVICNNLDMTNTLKDLYTLRKNDGLYYHIFNDNYYLSFFYGLIPLNKNDKLYMSIIDLGGGTFYTKYSVRKSSCILNLYISYMKIPHRVIM